MPNTEVFAWYSVLELGLVLSVSVVGFWALSSNNHVVSLGNPRPHYRFLMLDFGHSNT